MPRDPRTDWQDIHAVADLLEAFDHPWFVAGGWAIDLYLDRQTRPHQDVEVAVFRKDQHALRSHLDGWSFEKVVDGERRPWAEGEHLELPVHELHARNPDPGGLPADLEVLLNEREDGEWVFRREPTVTRALSEFGMESTVAPAEPATAVPHLAPEVVLLYKLPVFGDRDQRDFEACLPTLDGERRRWLTDAIGTVDPDHPWLAAL